MLKKLVTSLLLIYWLNNAFAQHSGNFFIKNYNRKDYQASIANFNIIQDNNGFIYCANYRGVLSYTGVDWNLITAPHNSAVYALANDEANCIYVGLKNDFGYLEPDQAGRARYISLSQTLPDTIEFSGIKKIITTGDYVYFFSKEVIFLLNKAKKLRVIPAGKEHYGSSIHQLKDKIFCIQNGKGLIEITTDAKKPILDHNAIPEKYKVTYISSTSDDKVLVGTANNGLFNLSTQALAPLSNHLSNYLSAHNLHTGLKADFDGNTFFIFGTFENGVVKTDEHLNVFLPINKSSGLQSNLIRDLEIDEHEGLWAAMQEGISRIEINSPWRYWSDKNGMKGTPWDILRHNDTLYVATTSGLFYLNNNVFHKVNNLDGKVWTLSTIKSSKESRPILLAGSESGLYEISYDKAKPIENLPGISKMYSLPQNPEKVIIGALAGIYEITLNKKNRYLIKKLSDVKRNTFCSILADSQSNLWISSKSKGIYYIPSTRDTSRFTLYNESDGLPDINDIYIFNQDNQLLFATDHGIYRLEHQENSTKRRPIFIQDTGLFRNPANINIIAQTRKQDLFTSLLSPTGKEHIREIKKVSPGLYEHETIPFRRLPEMEVIAIYPEDNGVVWIGGSEGLFRYDSKVKKDYTLPFNTLIRKASVSDSVIFHGFYPKKVENSDIPGIGIIQPESYQPTLTFEDNNITFEYSATSYDVPEKNQFSYYLENNDHGWSSWSFETKKEYNNLDPGEYTFYIKSKNIYDTEGKIATYKFTVLAPWYQTSWAYALFTILAGLFIWLITMAYSLRIRMQRKKLRLVVADRTYEVMSQKKEIEKQNTLLKAKNEEINLQKDDIEFKNIQLKESQEEILSMNHKLTELNIYLEKKVENRTSKIKSTLKKLQQINGELDTFVYRASHDLKGPISRINGITSLAKLESPDAINLKYFNLIEETAKDMEVLLSKLAQVHEIINTTLDKDKIDIPTLLSKVRNSVKFLDKGHATKYSFELDGIALYSDRHLLNIILKNLIENALIFRKDDNEDPHHIHISTSSSNGAFHIKVHDNGIGIPPKDFNKVFHMFFRGSDKSKGSGLGLYLVKMCVDKIGATITIESEEDKFTEFTISIPV